ncbi:MAG: soluble NSF attachment family protein [Bacteroidota bacterium]|nr:soluble NSF attachment family protein [Bacteroidota bacterium]
MSKKTTNDTLESKDVDLGQVYTRTELFLDRNRKAITIGVVALLVVVGGVLGYKKFVAEPNAREASEMMWKAEYYFEIDSLNLALNGDDQWPGFLEVADRYGRTPAGNLAHYYIAAISMQQGEYELALEHYKKADLDDDVLRVMAVGNQGDALVELGRPEDAVKEFEKAAGMETNEFTTPMYLMKAGIVHQQLGDTKKAQKAFKRIADEFPTSADATQARKYAALAEASGN